MKSIKYDKINIEKIETKTMYRMIEELLKRDMYYEAKCLVDLFIEKRSCERELKTLYKIKELLFEYKLDEVKETIKETKIYWCFSLFYYFFLKLKNTAPKLYCSKK